MLFINNLNSDNEVFKIGTNIDYEKTAIFEYGDDIVLSSFFFRPLYCLFFDLPCLLITLLVSSLKQYRHWETTGEISKHFCVTV
jgi:hypothetical protein